MDNNEKNNNENNIEETPLVAPDFEWDFENISDLIEEPNTSDSSSTNNFLGLRWRDLSEAKKIAAFKELKSWVDWFVLEWKVPKIEVPDCWFLHTNIVAELYAAMCAETAIWDQEDLNPAGLTTLNYHFSLLRSRLHKKAEECLRNGEHIDTDILAGTHRFVIKYGVEWEQHLQNLSKLETP